MSGPQIIADRMRPILSLPEEEAYMLLSKEYKNFLSNVNDHPCFDEFKKSGKFILLLTQVCLAFPLLFEERVYCNAMVYKEINGVSEQMKELLLNLGYAANRTMVSAFQKCGLDRTMAIFLAISRKSSFQPKDCIFRMNFVIMCTSPELMTTQRITDIYCASCSSVEDVTRLFIYTIRDAFIYNSNDSWITKDHLLIADRMNSALLSILESLSETQIFNLLEEYHAEALLLHLDEEDVRFSFKKLNCMTFPKIAKVLNDMAKHRHYLP